MRLFSPVARNAPDATLAGIHLALYGLMQLEHAGAGSYSQPLQVDSEESTGTRIRLPISYIASQLLSWQYLPAPSPRCDGLIIIVHGMLIVSADGVLDVTAYRKDDVNILLSSGGVTPA